MVTGALAPAPGSINEKTICLRTLYPSRFVDLNVLEVESTRDAMARRPSVFDYFGLMFYFEWVARPVHVMD